MLEDLGEFFARNARPERDWKSQLAPWADIAAARAADLEAFRPGSNGLLLETAGKLQAALSTGNGPGEGASRAAVAMLGGYLLVSASTLHEHLIPSHEADAHAAALDVDWAVQQVLIGMENDYGQPDLTSRSLLD